jgi:2-methylisoborneol synthase
LPPAQADTDGAHLARPSLPAGGRGNRPSSAGRSGPAATPAPDVSPSGTLGSLAGLISALLSDPRRPDPTRLPAPRSDHARASPGRTPPADGLSAPRADHARASAERTPPADGIPGPLAIGPTGLGTAAARLAARSPSPGVVPIVAPGGPPLLGPPSGFGTSAWWIPGGRPASAGGQDVASDTTTPELFCPGVVRDDPALGEDVNDRLVDWAEQVGIYAGRLDKLRAYNFGRLIMLAHPGSDDPDRLLAATKCVVAEWAADDYYVDEVDLGADPSVVASRLTLLIAVVDPRRVATQYAPQFDDYSRAEPIVRAFRTAIDHMARYASTTQIARFQHQMGILFVAWTQEAEWHRTGRTPPVWEYLVQRHLNSYLPPMLLVDPVAGYELPPNEYFDPRVRQAFTTAGAANVLLNDLYSAPFESDTDFNLPRVIALEEGCTEGEAIRRTVEIHNELMHSFVSQASALSITGSPMLHRFFVDTWAWMGGSREWHANSGRFQPGGGA